MANVLIFSIIFSICYVLAEKSEFTSITELPKINSKEDDIQADIIRANSSQLILDKNNEEESKKTDKKPRTAVHRESNLDTRDNSSCCDSRYAPRGSIRPDHNYNKIPLIAGRYPPQYGERQPIDRHGWQTQNRPSVGSSSRPAGTGGYGGNGIYGGSQSGDRYGPRPVYGSETANRPNTLGYGSGNGGYGISSYGNYGRPSGYGGPINNSGYGISGTLADGDEFGPADTPYPDGSMPLQPGNLQTQKAVALKALAGVALIGAAAALASNPVLLPIGIVAGRKKRSESFSEEVQDNFEMNYVLHMIKKNLAQIRKNASSNRVLISPRCVARMTCEIQKDYLSNTGKDIEILNENENRKHHLTKLLQNKVFDSISISGNMKDLIRFAVDVANDNKNCNIFPCNYIRKG